MSQPNPQAELIEYMHDMVHEYCHDWCGESSGDTNLIPYLHEEIDNPKKRTDLYEEFCEFIQESLTN